MKKDYLLLITALLLLLNNARGQELSGKIYDDQNEPLIGATVTIENTDYYGVSGLDGSYVIKLKDGSFKGLVRYVGDKSQTFYVSFTNGKKKTMDFHLQSQKNMINDVVVVANASGRTIAGARINEQKSDNVLNVISSKAIDLSPDLDVASVIQRISGVSLDMGSSTGQSHAIIRGMSKRYNYSLVNGIKIPSPDDKNRYVPLDIFPSALLDKVEVYKTLTPIMEGDAAGGVINMVMKDAPDKLEITANATIGYHELFMPRHFEAFDSKDVKDKTPFELNGYDYSAKSNDFTTKTATAIQQHFVPDIDASVSFGNRYFNHKLGMIVAASYNNYHDGSNSTRLAPDLLEGSSLPKLTNVSYRQYSNHITRMGLHAKLDYKINNTNHLKFYLAYISLQNDEVREDSSISILGSETLANSDRQTMSTRFTKTTQTIKNMTLQGNHYFNNNQNFKWSLVTSFAKKEEPDQNYFVRTLNRSHKSDGSISWLIAEDGDNERIWRRNSDKDYAGYLDYDIKIHIGAVNNDIGLGGLGRYKFRNSFYNAYNFDPDPGVQAFGYNWKPDDGVNYSTWEKYSDVKFRVDNPGGSTTNALNNNFYVYHGAAYLQLKTNYKKLELIYGARYEYSKWKYSLLAPRPNQEPNGKRISSDILPSIHVKYAITKKSNARVSYYTSVIRPGYYEILPYNDMSEDYYEIGNPNIKDCKVYNYDARYENFFGPTDQFMIGLFYKEIVNPIEYARFSGYDTWSNINGWVRMPNNFGTAHNYGFDVDFTKYIRNFGFRFNYTFTNSKITQTKQYKHRQDPNDDTSEIITTTVEQTRPLQGQAQNIGNASLLYNNQASGWNGQLSFVYTGSRIKNVSNYIDNDEWEKAMLKVDMSIEKKINKLTFFVKAKNLLNTPYITEIKQPLREENTGFPLQGKIGDNYVIRKDMYMRSFRVGIKISL